jgi:hypothetical protein
MSITNFVASIDIDSIFAENDRNVRMDEYMQADYGSSLCQNIEDNGFRIDKPLTVAEIVDANGGPTRYRVIQGHRRFRAAKALNAKKPNTITEIPCLVFRGLTVQEEMKMLVDQVEVKMLNSFEQYLVVKRLLMAGYSEPQIMAIGQFSRGFVQKRKQIASLPPCVEKAWHEKSLPKSKSFFPNLTDAQIGNLYTAFMKDVSADISPEDPESGFKKLWDGWMEGKPTSDKPKAMTVDQIKEKSLYVKDPILSDLLDWTLGKPRDLNTITGDIKNLREQAVMVGDVKVQLADLNSRLTAALARIDELTALAEVTNAAYEARIAELLDAAKPIAVSPEEKANVAEVKAKSKRA